MRRRDVLRAYQTRGQVGRAIAELIVAGALADGDRLYEDDGPAPDGDDVSSEITRAQMARREAAHAAEWEAALRYDAEADAATRAFFAARAAERGAE